VTPTIYELPPALFSRAAPVFASAWCDQPYLDAVLHGKDTGRIFVDDAEHPTAALMTRSYEYFVGGEPVAALMPRCSLISGAVRISRQTASLGTARWPGRRWPGCATVSP
jgi:hypothetical protein